ncbi:hypothetical protein J3Y89_003220 [Salmonella enterica]|nr:hypothetical protein [Salmonella enterica]
MDTGILHLTGRSCHRNKSQRADPFIVLSHIIAGKTKCVKDPFLAMIHAKARQDKGFSRFKVFWEKWGNARTKMSRSKREENTEREVALREFWSGYTPVTLPVFTQRNVVADYCQLR